MFLSSRRFSFSLAFAVLCMSLAGCSATAKKSLNYQPFESYGGSGFYQYGTGYFEKREVRRGKPLWLVGFAGDDALVKNRFIAYAHSFRRSAEIAKRIGATHVMLLNKDEWGRDPRSSDPTSYSFSGMVDQNGAVAGRVKPNYGGADLDYTQLSIKYGGDISYLLLRIGSPDCSVSECRSLNVSSNNIFDVYYNVWYPANQIAKKYGRISRATSK